MSSICNALSLLDERIFGDVQGRYLAADLIDVNPSGDDLAIRGHPMLASRKFSARLRSSRVICLLGWRHDHLLRDHREGVHRLLLWIGNSGVSHPALLTLLRGHTLLGGVVLRREHVALVQIVSLVLLNGLACSIMSHLCFVKTALKESSLLKPFLSS